MIYDDFDAFMTVFMMFIYDMNNIFDYYVCYHVEQNIKLRKVRRRDMPCRTSVGLRLYLLERL